MGKTRRTFAQVIRDKANSFFEKRRKEQKRDLSIPATNDEIKKRIVDTIEDVAFPRVRVVAAA